MKTLLWSKVMIVLLICFSVSSAVRSEEKADSPSKAVLCPVVRRLQISLGKRCAVALWPVLLLVQSEKNVYTTNRVDSGLLGSIHRPEHLAEFVILGRNRAFFSDDVV